MTETIIENIVSTITTKTIADALAAGIIITEVQRSSPAINPKSLTPPQAFVIWNRVPSEEEERQLSFVFDVAIFCRDEKTLLDLVYSLTTTADISAHTGFRMERSRPTRFELENAPKQADNGLTYSITVYLE